MSSEASNRGKKPKRQILAAIFSDILEFIGVSNTFKEVRGDFSEMRKAWKSLIVIVLVVGGAVFYFTTNHFSSVLEEEKNALGDDYDRKVKGQDKVVSALRFDLLNTRAERDKAELELAPWKDRAKKEFPFDDVTSGLAKLDAKVETVLSMFRSSIVHPLNEPINSAMCTVSVSIVTDTPGDGAADLFRGGYAAIGVGNKAGLMASTVSHRKLPEGKIEFVGAASVFDPFMGKPVSTILTGQYIQIAFHKSAVEKDTQILGGVAVWVINNRITLTFQIPPQKAEPDGTSENSRIFIRLLRPGLEPLSALAQKETQTP